MRVSSAQIFDSGTRGMGRNQFDLYKLQNQLSSRRKNLTPADDPIAAAQSLVLTQSKDVSAQYLKNQDAAKGRLSLLDSQLNAMTDLMLNVRDKVVQAGNTTLTAADRSFIANEIESRFSELMGIANSEDGTGSYLFSGYQGTVRPFSSTDTGANYAGDDGERLTQVESSRQMATSVSGSELFEKIRNGNGTFETTTGTNQGSALIDRGSVNNLANWNKALSDSSLWFEDPSTTPPTNHAGEIDIEFDDSSGVMKYELFSLDNLGARVAIDGPNELVAGQSIALKNTLTATPSVDFGISVSISGAPIDGDKFSIKPSTDQSIFSTLRNTINTISNGTSAATGNTSTKYSNDLATNLIEIDNAMENILRVRASVGSRLNEIDSLTNSGEDLQIQYKSSLSELQDLDYAEAISQLSKTQIQLEAAQISFKQISQLSLFSIL